jgi:hypothetical protein
MYFQQNIQFRRVSNSAIPIQYSFHHQISIVNEHKNDKKYISTMLQLSLKYIDALTEVTAFEDLVT